MFNAFIILQQRSDIFSSSCADVYLPMPDDLKNKHGAGALIGAV